MITINPTSCVSKANILRKEPVKIRSWSLDTDRRPAPGRPRLQSKAKMQFFTLSTCRWSMEESSGTFTLSNIRRHANQRNSAQSRSSFLIPPTMETRFLTFSPWAGRKRNRIRVYPYGPCAAWVSRPLDSPGDICRWLPFRQMKTTADMPR
jgi:hypothetical protein